MRAAADQQRFVELLETHKRILYKVANAYCRHDEDRRDLVQEMVAQLWRSFASYDERFRFSTWMYRVAMNVAISMHRTESRRPVVALQDVDVDLTAADQMMSDDLRELHRRIARLDPMSRALVLLYLDGHDHAAIAEILGITATNVATRMSRIRTRLQEGESR